MENDIDWEELSQIEDQVLNEHAKDPKLYGQPGNEFNPFLHLLAMTDGDDTMNELITSLSTTLAMLCHLRNIGWELSEPVEGGAIYTKWEGLGSPPIEESELVEIDGVLQDIEGNVVDLEDEDDEE